MLAVVVISLAGVVQFLLVVAVIVFLIVGLKFLGEKMGMVIPPPMLAILGFILFLLLVLYALGIFGAPSGVVFR